MKENVRSRKPLDVGLDITTALPEIIRNVSEIRSINLLTLATERPVNERIGRGTSLHKLVQQGLALQAQTGLSFWQSVLLAAPAAKLDGEPLKKLFGAAVFHPARGGIVSSERVSVKELDENALKKRNAQLRQSTFLAMSSLVETSSKERMHLPLLDFRVPFSPENTRIVLRMVEQIGMPGVILRSSTSYHYYGITLLRSATYFGDFLGRALLLAPVTDPRWIAHQMIEAQAMLRISPDSQSARLPTVCGVQWQ